MTILYYVAMGLHIFACLFLIAVVLLQQGKGQDLASAFGGGGTQAAFGPRGSANLLSRATTVLAVVFMITSLSLSVVRPRESSILDQLPSTQQAPASGSPAVTLPAEALPPPAGSSEVPASESSEAAPATEGTAPPAEAAP
jgi:preprotein translocase subunit SecG